ncbi:MAG: glycosyltransferase family 4 protein [Aeoliella sp.]
MMVHQPANDPRIGYVLKRYPRFSETFIVNEILAHEAAGARIDIFALRPPADTHFQPGIAKVRGPVQYLRSNNVRAGEFWTALEPWLQDDTASLSTLAGSIDTEGQEVYQAFQLAVSVRKRRIEHLHAHFGTSAATVARLASLLTGVPYSFTAHAKDIFHEYVDSDALGQKITDASAVVTVSDYNVNHLREAYPADADKVVRVYNGLPLDDFPFCEYDHREPLIVAVGRLVEKKGFADLISACAILQQRGVRFRCEIVGGGDEELRLQRQIQDAGLVDRVHLTGPLPLDAVADRLRQASMLVASCITASTGDRDGLPTVLLEAMALGTPAIATAVTGIPEVVHDEQTGLLLPERQPARLAKCITQLLNAPSLGERLAIAARALIESEFDGCRNTAALREVFGHTCALNRELVGAV